MIGSKYINTQALQPYKMSFTSGGLFLNESISVAELHSVDKSWSQTLNRALEVGTTSLPKAASNRRTLREIVNRLSTLNDEEIRFLIDEADLEKVPTNSVAEPTLKLVEAKLEASHKVFAENRKGISYDKIFGPYVAGASKITVTDPYVRYFYQIKNMMEFVEMIIQRKPPEDQVSIHLVTGPDDGNVVRQRELLDSICGATVGTGVEFTWAFDGSGTAHARDINTDTGWKIVLDRGLDIFQAPIKRDGFSTTDRLQEHRAIKGFYATYLNEGAK